MNVKTFEDFGIKLCFVEIIRYIKIEKLKLNGNEN